MKKWLMPVLATSVLAAGVTTATASEGKRIKGVEFFGMDTARTAEQKQSLMYSNAAATVTYKDGSQQRFPLSYETLFRTGDVINGKIAGVTMYANGTIATRSNGTPYVSTAPDMNSLIQVPGMPANTYYLITHYESLPKNENGADNPGSMSLTTVQKDPATGKLKAIDIKPIDFSAVHGIWKPCAGSLTPWNTHLGSEETEPDARAHEANPGASATTKFMRNYYQDAGMTGNPYYYGHVPEVTVQADGSTNVVKHYSMGRLAFERVQVMKDKRTVLYGVDINPGGFFMYVADKAGKLSAGTLYAAKWVQINSANGGYAKLEWIPLGHATDKEIEALADTTKFSDIFDVTDNMEKAKEEGYVRVKTAANGKKEEWLKVKPGMEKAAAFLETHRYAAYVGATVEFNKMEGLDVNEKDGKGYVAMSFIEGAMQAEANVPTDHIQVPKLTAGGIYEFSFRAGLNSTDGKRIESAYIPFTMKGMLMGEDLPAADADGNRANVNKIANPDNIVYSPKMRTLFIAEDSDLHTNCVTWSYNVDTKKLSRLISVPGGGEATGLQMIENLDGHTYLMTGAQNPAYVGYLAGLPSLQNN